MISENVESILEILFGSEGLNSSFEQEERSAFSALESLMRKGEDAIGSALLMRLRSLLDRAEAESLSASDLRIYQTPKGKRPFTWSQIYRRPYL